MKVTIWWMNNWLTWTTSYFEVSSFLSTYFGISAQIPFAITLRFVHILVLRSYTKTQSMLFCWYLLLKSLDKLVYSFMLMFSSFLLIKASWTPFYCMIVLFWHQIFFYFYISYKFYNFSKGNVIQQYFKVYCFFFVF